MGIGKICLTLLPYAAVAALTLFAYLSMLSIAYTHRKTLQRIDESRRKETE